MSLGLSLRSLRLSSGQVVEVPPGGVLLLVGPNNVGKSAALRDVSLLFTNPPQPGNMPKVVTEIDVHKQGGVEELEAWLDQHAHRREPSAGFGYRRYTKVGIGQMSWPDLQSHWTGGPPFHATARLFMSYLGPTDRHSALNSTQLWDMLNEDPQQPLQLLYERNDLERQLCAAAVAAFEQPIFVNRYGGSSIHLQLGTPPEDHAPPVPRTVMEALQDLPHAHEQGDGVRSFLGIMLTLLAADERVFLIDEPEAFLHPPQARLLGKNLAETTATSGIQVLAATHSADVVVGMLEAESAQVTVVRITREGSVNYGSVLSHERLRDLWADPFLRYSNILDGLFHKAVVVCEADSDALFFSAALDEWLSSRDLPVGEVFFTYSAGKSRLGQVAAALKAVDVPVLIIADLDILQDSADLVRAIDALGGSASDVLELQKRFSPSVELLGQAPRLEYVRDNLGELLNGCRAGEPIPQDKVAAMRKLLRNRGGWDELKRSGLATLSGDTLAQAHQAIKLAQDVGLLILSTGELESYDRTIGGHGPDWVAAALEREVHKSAVVEEFTVILAKALGIHAAVEAQDLNASSYSQP